MSSDPQGKTMPSPAEDASPVRFDVKPTAESHFSWLRTRLSVERTLMSWVRTATALIGFGFTIVQFFERLHGMEGVAPALRPQMPRYLGLALIGAGIAGVLISIWQYRKLVAYLLSDYRPIAGVPSVTSHTPLQAIALALVVIGAFAFGAVLLRAV
jgi:putative membrane protein